MKVYRVSKGSVKTSEMEWRYVIYTRRGWGMQMREKKVIHRLEQV